MSLSSTTLTSLLQNHNTSATRASTSRFSLTEMPSPFDRFKKPFFRKNSVSRDAQPKPSSSNSFLTRRPSNREVAKPNPPNDPPPAYSEDPASLQSPPQLATTVAPAVDDPYEFLASFDTIFVIDDSTSMTGRSWNETAEALKLIAPICATYDSDGIDIYFLNSPDSKYYKNVTDAATVTEIFQSVRPNGATPTGQKLQKILMPYVKEYEKKPDSLKPINVIVITDGVPTDDVESPLIQVAKKLDKCDAPAWQVGVQFFQVGNDPRAREHLKGLDDNMRDISGIKDLRDMIDTVAFQSERGEPLSHTGVLKVVCGSINRRLDRNSKELHRRTGA